MKIYDISQEVFHCQVYAGDPAPEKKMLCSMESGDLYNLTSFGMCAHNGTHIDAPFHFIKGGKTVDSLCLDTFVGMAYVAEHHGIVSGDDAAEMLEKANRQNPEEFLSRGTPKSLWKRQMYLPPLISLCLGMNPRQSGLKTPRWKCTSYCWEPV